METKTHLTQTLFANLELSTAIVQSLNNAGFSHCTPIQERTLPIALRDRDVAGQAQTGTGKTGAFLVAVFQRLLNSPGSHGPRALVLAPTRELALQIHKDALTLGKGLGFNLALIYGGVDYEAQEKALKNPIDLLIGTPGRVIDFVRQKKLNFSRIQAVVMDEADRMFDLGFIRDIRFLLKQMPPREARLNLLFSATLSYRVTELAYEYMNQPVMVKVESETVTAEAVRQRAYCPANEQKLPLLLGLLNAERPERAIIFVNTKVVASRLFEALQARGFKVIVLSGDVLQSKREALLARFQKGQANIMIATDVAARGLHIPQVSHVLNYDLPQDVEDYVHRIGRTARFGASGDAISFVCEQYAYSMPEIETYIGARIPVLPIEATLLEAPDRADGEAQDSPPLPA
ncbi:MAG: DEAD/DEAH box helicase [Methylococcales bacterium]|nr:DEAD/DEAH box helicase [Methylococcales bacterium]